MFIDVWYKIATTTKILFALFPLHIHNLCNSIELIFSSHNQFTQLLYSTICIYTVYFLYEYMKFKFSCSIVILLLSMCVCQPPLSDVAHFTCKYIYIF